MDNPYSAQFESDQSLRSMILPIQIQPWYDYGEKDSTWMPRAMEVLSNFNNDIEWEEEPFDKEAAGATKVVGEPLHWQERVVVEAEHAPHL